MKKTIFEKAGGFDETLAVAFNDVDLCYKIYEEGYYNVVRNDLFLFHHESLSRGRMGIRGKAAAASSGEGLSV